MTNLSNLKIINLEEDKNLLTFTIEKINVSYVNALRRILLANIPIIVFKAFPYNENKVNIEINKSRLNNELIKQRLSCIPIHINDIENFTYEDYEIELDKKNESNEIIYATTEDFKIKNVKLNQYLTPGDVKKIFPPNNITGDYIDIVRLRPQINNNFCEEIKLKAKLTVSSAEEDGAFNVVSLATYGNTQDPTEIKKQWDIKEKELIKTYSEEEIEEYKTDWLLIEAKKYFVNNSFVFKLQSIGIYSNIELMYYSCKILIKKLFYVVEDLKNNSNLINEVSDYLDNCFEITIQNEDYTVGKIIENYFYEYHFINKKTISYISFVKKHPHDKNSIIKISYNYIITKDEIITQVEESINYAISNVNSIQEYFSI
jgi:DNA-directed RNA polymerase subunit L